MKDKKAFVKFQDDFKTSTRNYAKRQMMWYRKDELFLWLGVFRKDIEINFENPYKKVTFFFYSFMIKFTY